MALNRVPGGPEGCRQPLGGESGSSRYLRAEISSRSTLWRHGGRREDGCSRPRLFIAPRLLNGRHPPDAGEVRQPQTVKIPRTRAARTLLPATGELFG